MWNNFIRQRLQLFLPHATPSGKEYLDHRFFNMMLALALVLHLLALFIWYLSPATHVVEIPVRALNIKLGDGEPASEELKAAQPRADNNQHVENAISRLVRDQEQETQARSKSVNTSIEKAMAALDRAAAAKLLDKNGNAQTDPHKTLNAKQFVRTSNTQTADKQAGVALGNSSEKEAEIISRYEQLISLWIEKFKLYPAEARAQGMQGDTLVRIRIDRQGNINYYILERSTGFQLLDRAAIDMVKRANPVPAVPNGYPQNDLMEFLIPVSFHLQ